MAELLIGNVMEEFLIDVSSRLVDYFVPKIKTPNYANKGLINESG
jgi:hypothetical protein